MYVIIFFYRWKYVLVGSVLNFYEISVLLIRVLIFCVFFEKIYVNGIEIVVFGVFLFVFNIEYGLFKDF